MVDEKLAQIRARTANIRRYRRLLQTQLTELERDFLRRRLQEEQDALSALTAEAFPLTIGAAGRRQSQPRVSGSAHA